MPPQWPHLEGAAPPPQARIEPKPNRARAVALQTRTLAESCIRDIGFNLNLYFAIVSFATVFVFVHFRYYVQIKLGDHAGELPPDFL